MGILGRGEPLTGFLSTISSDHSYIHSGIAFTYNKTTASLAAAALEKFGFTTPAKEKGYVHFRPSRISSVANACQLTLRVDTPFSGGTLQIAQNRNQNKRLTKKSFIPLYKLVTAALVGKGMVTTNAGGNFANQPADDGVEVVSDSALDITQIVTIYGTIQGAATVIVSETIALNGTTAVAGAQIHWGVILGIELSAACAGTITIREASADATIITIAAASLSAGIAVIAEGRARYTIPTRKGSGATTKILGVIGTDYLGEAYNVALAMDGATDAVIGATPLTTITKVLVGDVESARTVTITRPEVILDSIQVGSGATSARAGGEATSDMEIILEPETNYVVSIENVGASTATTADVTLFWYEEESAGV
jgi:hypothetical protein